MLNITQKFIGWRTGDVVLSSGENIGDLIIFIGRHSTLQHSCILVWLDIPSLKEHKVKVHSHYIDDETTKLSFLGLAEGSKLDVVTQEPRKGLILWEPEYLFTNAPIIYIRPLNSEYIKDDYVVKKMEEYIEEHHLKMKYAYGKDYIVTVGLGFDILGPKKDGSQLCSGNVYLFLKHLCDYPNFKIENQLIESLTYKLPDCEPHMIVPDMFSSEHNSHPVFDSQEYRVLSKKNEEDVTVSHPYFIVFVILLLIVVLGFFIVYNYYESCKNNPMCRSGICMPGQRDFFDFM